MLISPNIPQGTHLSPFVPGLSDKLSAGLENKVLHALEVAVTDMKRGNNVEQHPDVSNMGGLYITCIHVYI